MTVSISKLHYRENLTHRRNVHSRCTCSTTYCNCDLYGQNTSEGGYGIALAPARRMTGTSVRTNRAALKPFLAVMLGASILTMWSTTPQAQSAISPLWKTTFACAEWLQTSGADPCSANDGIDNGGNWTTAAGKGDQITAAANHSAGGGGLGFRHWRGNGGNNNGGGLRITLPTRVSEMWLRWYMRYQAGFSWNGLSYTKDLYVNQGSANSGQVFTMGFHWDDAFGVSKVSGGRNMYGPPGWFSLMGGQPLAFGRPVSDGQWHFFEVHVKMATSGANGIAESWVDGVLAHRQTDVDWGTTGGWDTFILGSNQCCVANTTDVYTDYDDVAISTTGYIGPFSGSSSAAPPTAPKNLAIR
jgi:hypothetical protein